MVKPIKSLLDYKDITTDEKLKFIIILIIYAIITI